MANPILSYLLAKLFQDGFKEIEKQDFVTRALEICRKNQTIRDVWPKFTDSIIDLLMDAVGEVRKSKEWK